MFGFPNSFLTSPSTFLYAFQNSSALAFSDGILNVFITNAVSPKLHPLISPHTSLFILISAGTKIPLLNILY